ncbi:M23 family metallopeptidase [Paenarthrobacter sp. NPDC090520]|uniref:M23 family metallopeptidase n=1 Tax=Paenarthrobacter sp. NPDC090520 TaxID=3364382 RepID=UPI0038194B1E
MRPVDSKWPQSQGFGSYATAGVAGNPRGSIVQQLVAQYGDYQPFGHAGEDIACPIGTPVHALADGVVVWAGWAEDMAGDESDWGYRQRFYVYKRFPGILTVIRHDNRSDGLLYSLYGHLSSNDIAPQGTVVKEGDQVALSGNTASRTSFVAAHLHVEALVDMSFRSSGGLIYGRTDPSRWYGATSPKSYSVDEQWLLDLGLSIP